MKENIIEINQRNNENNGEMKYRESINNNGNNVMKAALKA
jgi:hypothetical protein